MSGVSLGLAYMFKQLALPIIMSILFYTALAHFFPHRISKDTELVGRKIAYFIFGLISVVLVLIGYLLLVSDLSIFVEDVLLLRSERVLKSGLWNPVSQSFLFRKLFPLASIWIPSMIIFFNILKNMTSGRRLYEYEAYCSVWIVFVSIPILIYPSLHYFALLLPPAVLLLLFPLLFPC